VSAPVCGPTVTMPTLGATIFNKGFADTTAGGGQSVPLRPVPVTVKVPLAVPLAVVTVRVTIGLLPVAVPVTAVLLNEPTAPAGRPETDKSAVQLPLPLNPTVTGNVTVPPALIAMGLWDPTATGSRSRSNRT
jgi:hypothetical protein